MMRSVVVTGGSRGLGLAIAEGVARAGLRAVVVARTESAALRDAMAAWGDAMAFCACDLSDLAAIPGLSQLIKRQYAPVYGLVNNAGIGTAGILATLSDARIEQLIRLNVTSPITLTKYLVRPMMTARAVRVVNVSSIFSGTGFNGLAA